MVRMMMAGAAALALAACGQAGADADAKPAGPAVAVEKAGAEYAFVGWDKATTGLPAGVTFRLTPRDPSLRGAALWFAKRETDDLEAAFKAAARAAGVEDPTIAGRAPIAKATLLDRGGAGRAFVGAGRRDGARLFLAGVVLYGSLDDSPRSSGVHLFAAPAPVAARLGGWVAPAALWFDLDPVKHTDGILKQGARPAQAQAETFAQIADIWIDAAVTRAIVQGFEMLKALNNARVMAVCGGPDNPSEDWHEC